MELKWLKITDECKIMKSERNVQWKRKNKDGLAGRKMQKKNEDINNNKK